MQFINWYKNNIEQYEMEPPEFVWENIQNSLDIEQSWQVVNRHLLKRSLTRKIGYVSFAASFLVLLFLGGFWFLNSIHQNKEFKALVNTVSQADSTMRISEVNMPNQFISENYQEAHEDYSSTESIHRDIFMPSNKGYSTTNADSVEVGFNKKDIHEDIIIAKPFNKGVNIQNEGSVDIVKNDMYKYVEESSLKRGLFQKFYIGSTGQLANTWLLNDKTFLGFENSSLTTSNASFGTNLGIFFGTNLSKKIDLQLDLNVFVQNNQTYNEYISGHYVENKMRFNYSQVALSARYYIISKRMIQCEHGINFGAYAGYLHNAYQTIGEETIQLTSNYTTFDYGVFLSYEYLIPLNSKLGLGTGFKAYYGLRNIYSGNEYIPAYLNQTNNASINLSVSLRYLIK